MLTHVVQIADELLTMGYLVLASTRDPAVTSYLQGEFVGTADQFTTSIPAQILADRSDLVMSRDSSIGWQSLSGSKTVLVYHVVGYPSVMEVTLHESLTTG